MAYSGRQQDAVKDMTLTCSAVVRLMENWTRLRSCVGIVHGECWQKKGIEAVDINVNSF